jgi:hypothetical protein
MAIRKVGSGEPPYEKRCMKYQFMHLFSFQSVKLVLNI